jgi:thiamine monophosphate synthase
MKWDALNSVQSVPIRALAGFDVAAVVEVIERGLRSSSAVRMPL